MIATITEANSISRNLVAVLRSILGLPKKLIPLHEPILGRAERKWVTDCLDSGWVSSVGPFVTRFEEEVAKACSARNAIVVSNGTSALQVCLIGAGVGYGDEVIVPSLTFVATANAVSHCGAVPHFVDAETATLGLDPVKLAERLDQIGEFRGAQLFNRETGRRVAAIVPVHIFGHPVQMQALSAVADKYHLPIVEDAAEALGSFDNDGRSCGSLSGIAALSFNGNKIVTTGGGGAVLVQDDDLAKKLRHLSTTGKLPHKWHFVHDIVAFNYRMPNLNAALGLAQMARLEEFISAKRALASAYADMFQNISGMRFFRERAGTRSNYWLNTVLLDEADESLREQVLADTNNAGFQTRPLWMPLHELPIYLNSPRGDLSVTENLALRIINIPSGASLGPQGIS